MSDKIRATFHGAKTLPVAAIPKGTVVRLYRNDDPSLPRDFKVVGVSNSDPVAGQIRWTLAGYDDTPVFGASKRVEIVSLP